MKNTKEGNHKQFVTVPNIDLQKLGLEMSDILIYAYLKKHYNSVTKDSFPSFQCLAEESGVSKPTVIKCVERLQQAGYINIIKNKKVNHYTFSEINKFEIYSFDFLDDKTISSKEKAYMICMQQHMYKNPELGIGKVTFSELDIAEMLKIDIRTLRKYESNLQQRDKPIVTLVPSKVRDPKTGLMIEERIFDFSAYNNLLALKFREIDTKLDQKVSIEDYNKLLKEVKEIRKALLTKEVTPIQL